MFTRLGLAVLSATLVLSAAKKTSGSGRGENEDLTITATVYLDAADIKNLLGNDLGGHYIVADVKVEPKYGKEVTIDRDDFILRTDKDGERDHPYEGSQIAGKTALVVGKTTATAAETQPDYSGVPVPLGGPLYYPEEGIGIGGGGGTYEANKATVKADSTGKVDPLQTLLDSKILPQKKTDKPVSGLLYFPMEKQKLKDLELLYGDKENRISMRFK
jgi:hypothetical protein